MPRHLDIGRNVLNQIHTFTQANGKLNLRSFKSLILLILHHGLESGI